MPEGRKGGGPPGHETEKDHSKIEPVLRELSRPVGTPSEAQWSKGDPKREPKWCPKVGLAASMKTCVFHRRYVKHRFPGCLETVPFWDRCCNPTLDHIFSQLRSSW